MYHFAKDLCLPELEIGWGLIHTSRSSCHYCMSTQRLSQARKMQAEMASLLGTKHCELTLLKSIIISYDSGGHSGNRGKARQKVSPRHWP